MIKIVKSLKNFKILLIIFRITLTLKTQETKIYHKNKKNLRD